MIQWLKDNKELSKHIDSLKDMPKDKRDLISNSIISKIYEIEPDLLTSNNVSDIPHESKRQQWYENDPNAWLFINALKNANDDLIRKILDCFNK
jgi:hypothetical protein